MSQPPFKTRVRSSCFQLYKQNVLSCDILDYMNLHVICLCWLIYPILSYPLSIILSEYQRHECQWISWKRSLLPKSEFQWKLFGIFSSSSGCTGMHSSKQEKNILMAFTFNLIWWLFKKIQGKCRSKKNSWFQSSQPHLHLPRFHWRLCFRPRCRYRVITTRHHHRIQIPIFLSDSNNT